MASNFIRDLSSFSKGANNLFSLDSTKNPCSTQIDDALKNDHGHFLGK